MDHHVNHKQTHADKDQQSVKKPQDTKTTISQKAKIYSNIVALLGKSQQAYYKAINKDRENREKTFSQRQSSSGSHSLHSMKSVGIK